MKKNLIVAAVMACAAMSAMAQDVDLTPKIGGTIRSKYEYQTEEGEGRFEVRNARINITGKVTPIVSYKAEIDLCDEGAVFRQPFVHCQTSGQCERRWCCRRI